VNISEASKRAGLPVKTVRYYDEIALVSPMRLQSGYRDYSEDDLHRLQFISRSRGLGFSIEDCRHLLSLYNDKSRASADVKHIVQGKLSEIDQKIAELQSMRQTLTHLATHCRGDSRPECPILEDLAAPFSPIDTQKVPQ